MPQSEEILRPDGVTRATWRQAPGSRWAFHHVADILPTTPVANAPEAVWALADAPVDLGDLALTLPSGGTMDLAAALKATDTDAMVVLRQGEVVFEYYAGGSGATTPHILMSGTKAVTGLLATMLEASGEIDLDCAVEDTLPQLQGGAWRGASLRQLLDMRAGVVPGPADSAAYERAHNSVAATGAVGPPDLHDLIAGLPGPERPHGGPFSYVSANTDLAAWAIETRLGETFSALLSERLWRPMGAERPASLILASGGASWTAGGLSVAARDFARLGQLILGDGRREGRAVIAPAVIEDLFHNGDREAWRTGEWGRAFAGVGAQMSYRAGWYVVHDQPGLMFAMGVHGQNLFIDRAAGVVIAKLSSQAERVDPRQMGLTHLLATALRRRLAEG